MKIIRDILTIFWKDFQLLLRDRGMLVVIILLPLIFGSLLSSMLSAQFAPGKAGESGLKLEVYLVNADDGDYGKQVADGLQKMNILAIDTLAVADTAQAQQGVEEGKRLAAILIPAGFSQKVEAHEGTEVVVVVDPKNADYASILKGLVNFAVAPVTLQGEIRYGIRSMLKDAGLDQKAPANLLAGIEAQTFGVVMTQMAAMLESPPISVNAVNRARNPDMPINAYNLYMPGFAVMFTFFLVSAIGESLFREREEGTFRRLQAAPISRLAIIGGKMLAFAVLIILQVAILFTVAAGFFKMELGNNLLGLLLVTVALSLVVTSLGLMVAVLSRTGKEADSIGIVLGFLLGGVGGCITFGLTPLFLQENPLALVSRFTPQGQALWGFYKLMSENASTVDILPQVGILLGMALVFAVIAAWRLRWD